VSRSDVSTAVARPGPPPTAPAASLGQRVVGWFVPVVPEVRVAILRSVVYVFVLLDMHLFVRDPIPLSHKPELYSPLLLERLFHLPPPSVPLAWGLYAVLWVSCLLGAANRLPRLAGFVVAAAFTWWTAIGMSYGKVDHDHLALIVALWVLPTVGVVRDRWRSTSWSGQAGWALKCIQIAVVFTYFLSALTKVRSGGWSYASWPNSAILMWAIVRRPHGLGQFLMPYPGLLRVMQWGAFLAETCSLVVLWLRGRALLCAAVFWFGFHVFTAAMLYIHFAPTLVCWLAFAPLERFAPWLRRVKARRRERAGRGATGQVLPVGGDQPVDSGR
jgi:hypothetical protein